MTAPLLLTAQAPFLDTGVPCSHNEDELENGISEAALPPDSDAKTTRHALPRDPSLLQETKICQHPVVVTLDMDSSAQDIRETMSQQEHTTKEESKVPSGTEEL